MNVSVSVCSGLATTQNPEIQIALQAGPQPPPSAPVHHLQILNHSTVLVSITHTLCFSLYTLYICLERNWKCVERQFFLDASLFRLCYCEVYLRLPSVCVERIKSFCNLCTDGDAGIFIWFNLMYPPFWNPSSVSSFTFKLPTRLDSPIRNFFHKITSSFLCCVVAGCSGGGV